MKNFEINTNLQNAAHAIAAELQRQNRTLCGDTDFDGIETRENRDGDYESVVIETAYPENAEPDTFHHKFILSVNANGELETDLTLNY